MSTIPTETFADYMGNARNKFVNDIQQQKWNTELRTSAEDILIAYDQMRKRIEECEGKEKEIEPETYFKTEPRMGERAEVILAMLKKEKEIAELKVEIERLKDAFLCEHCGQLINHP
jgi:hypothetical protein